jgi:hypothetical protein
MKKPIQGFPLMLAAIVFVCGTAAAQNYSIDWFSVDGGGGSSTGGVFTASGTIGQPDAGRMSGGSFTLEGGFWGIIAAVQTPGAPPLAILNTGTNAVLLSWPSPSTGFNLQHNSDLTTTNWTTLSVTPADDGTNKTVLITPAAASRFFRLKYP